MNLRDLGIGENARIESVGGENALRQHLLDMGVVPGAELTLIKFAPLGDPMELQIHSYELSLRLDDAQHIEVTRIDKRSKAHKHASRIVDSEHPGIGEEGKYHCEEEANPLPEGSKLCFALVGNQNSGKTTLFNQLTGSNHHVGNYPGVTVDIQSAKLHNHPNAEVVDLPGVYSLTPYSSEELLVRNYLLDSAPTAIINIVDATNLERNLYLTMQLIEMNIPMVVAINMMDELSGNGGYIDINEMEKSLGVPVVPISASKNEGVGELVRHALHIAQNQERPRLQDFCSNDANGGAVHRCIHSVMHLFEDHACDNSVPIRFAANKAIEGDEQILDRLDLDENERELLEHIVLQMEKERGLDRHAAIADSRFEFIEDLCERTVVKPSMSKERVRSEKIDRILTGKFTAIPCFIAIMGTAFFLTFNVIGAWLQNLLAKGVASLTGIVDAALTSAHVNTALHSLVIDGIFRGVGTLVSFLPIIVTLFFFLSLMEDTGYTARVAFVMDKIMRKLGLSGKSIVPMLIGFGCTVPAVMSTKTLPSERDRKMTILITPFMSCSAKLPVYAFFISAFFPGKGGLIMTGLYLLGITVGILVALLFKKTLFKGESVPFVMELPNYRLPSAKSVAGLLWEKAEDFLQRAFSVILVATIIIWFLQSFNWHFNYVTNSSDSMLADVAQVLAILLVPIGLGDWRISTALITGFLGKEIVIVTLNVLVPGDITSLITPLAAVSFLVFSLLYTPCLAAVASIKRELGGKWAVGVVLWQCIVAWIFAMLVRLIGLAIGMV